MLKKYVFFGGMFQNAVPGVETRTACSVKAQYTSTKNTTLFN